MVTKRPARLPLRALFTDERGAGLRTSWHPERGVLILSLWRADVCIGTFTMTPDEADRLGGFLAGHLDAAERTATG